jgi:hypothetical protein
VLVTRPAEEELSLTLAGLIDLFADGDGEVDAADDPLARGRAVLAALRDAVRDGPALVTIDDLQWLDAASARALRYALRRLDSEPLGVLATSPGRPPTARRSSPRRKNREISQALFMSVATVEAHLTRIYRKLDIRSRSELTRLVAEGSLSLPVGGPPKTPVQHV